MSDTRENSFTVSQMAAKLGVSAKTLQRLEARGVINPSRTMGNQRRYSDGDYLALKKYLQKNSPFEVLEYPIEPVTSSQLADELGVHEATVRRWGRDGQVVKLGSSGGTVYYAHPRSTGGIGTKKQLANKNDNEQTTDNRIISSKNEYIALNNSKIDDNINIAVHANKPKNALAMGVIGLVLFSLAGAVTYWLAAVAIKQPTSNESKAFGKDYSSQQEMVNNLKVKSFIENKALTDSGDAILTSLTLNPTVAPLVPEAGQMYFDQDTKSTMIYNGSKWVNFQANVQGLSFQDSYNLGSLVEADEADVVFEMTEAGSSDSSFLVRLLGNSSQFAISASNGETLLSIKPSSTPIALGKSTSVNGNLTATNMIGTADITVGDDLLFNVNGLSFYGSGDYVVSSGGLAVGDGTVYHFDEDGNLRVNNSYVGQNLEVDGMAIIDGIVGIGDANPSTGGLVVANGVTVGIDSTNNLIDDSSHGSGSTTLYIGNESINTTVSDERLKENITSTQVDAMAVLDKLRVVDFDWKPGNPRREKGRMTGLIAQEVEKILPQVVQVGEDNTNWAVEYHHIVPYLIKGIQDLGQTLQALSSKVNSIKSGEVQINSGNDRVVVEVAGISDDDRVIVTFGGDYSPASRYWIIKNTDAETFEVRLDNTVGEAVSLDWLIVR